MPLSVKSSNLKTSKPENVTVILLLGVSFQDPTFTAGLEADVKNVKTYCAEKNWTFLHTTTKKEFQNLVKQNSQKNRLIIIYSGHGSYDGNFTILSDTGDNVSFSPSELTEMIVHMSGPQSIELFLDSCYSAK